MNTPTSCPPPPPLPSLSLSLFAASSHCDWVWQAFGESFLGGAVIQQGQATELWGTYSQAVVVSPGQLLQVSINGHAVAHAQHVPSPWGGSGGNWSVALPPQAPSFSSTITVSVSTFTSTLDVAFGNVLMCGGQSNMGLAVGTGPFDSGRGLPAYGFHADNGTYSISPCSDTPAHMPQFIRVR